MQSDLPGRCLHRFEHLPQERLTLREPDPCQPSADSLCKILQAIVEVLGRSHLMLNLLQALALLFPLLSAQVQARQTGLEFGQQQNAGLVRVEQSLTFLCRRIELPFQGGTLGRHESGVSGRRGCASNRIAQETRVAECLDHF